ncbi:MAG: hypothetical protein ACK414_15965, partial [Gemmobacter sp.]
GPAEPPPLAQVAYRRDEPEAALEAIGLDPWTAVAIATHDLTTDQAALRAARAAAPFPPAPQGATVEAVSFRISVNFAR